MRSTSRRSLLLVLLAACVLQAPARAQEASVAVSSPPLPPSRPLAFRPSAEAGVPVRPPGLNDLADPGKSGPKPAQSAEPLRPYDDPTLPARPGTFARTPTQLPGTFLKEKMVAPRTGTPDVEIGVTDKTSVGLFGELSHHDRTDIRNSTVTPTRELGAGVTLQYRFGQ